MKKSILMLTVVGTVGLLAGCVEKEAYTEGYYSSGSSYPNYPTYQQSHVTSGYNRDYQSSRGGYSSSQQSQPQTQTQTSSVGGYRSHVPANNANNGYSSTAAKAAPSQETTPEAYYSNNSHSPNAYPPEDNGYSSSAR